MKRPLRHIFDYLVLVTVMSVAVIFTIIFNGNKLFQTITVVFASSVYVCWGIYHHHKEGTLHPNVSIEYLLYAILGTVLVLGLL